MGKAKNKRKSSSATDVGPGPKRSKKSSLGSVRPSQPAPTELSDNSRFGQLVKQAGFVLMAGDSPNQLKVDQAIFQMNLTKALKRSSDPEQDLEEFWVGLRDHIEDAVRFRYSLLPTTTTVDCESARGGSQEGLMRLLLGIDELQSVLINVLLEKLPEFMEDDDGMFDRSDAVNLPRLILNQFRWLDRVLNSEEMTSKMLEMVGVSSLSVQQEIIACIPEVVSDSDHNTVAAKLQDVLLSSSQLTTPVLDALSNLNLTPDLTVEVRNAALQTLLSASLEDLPVIIKFILQSVSSTDAVKVISELRENLDFASSPSPASQSRPPHHHRSSNRRGLQSKSSDSSFLILDAIKNNMRFHKVVTEGWLKVIANVTTATEHKVVDIIVLLIAHAVASNRKKQLESLLRGKVRAGLFREELLKEAFNSHAQVLRDYFPSILSLAEVLLRSPEPTVGLFACCIYREAFLAFDMYCRQEVIGSLVAHIGSGSEGEIEASFDVLLSLVEHHGNELKPFAIFIKGLLDYLANLSLRQIRKLFAVLSALAFRNAGDNTSIQDELHIVIRKQLSSNNPKYKRIGVIGALMIVRNLAHRPESDRARELSPEKRDEVVKLLELVRSSSNKMPETLALFFDELANIVEQKQLHTSVEKWIGDSILDDFQDNFVLDIEADEVSRDYVLPLGEVYGLEAEESQGGVAINLLPLVCKAERAQVTLDSLASEETEAHRAQLVFPLCMASHFRLMRVCEQAQHNGDLEGIDALLGCPLFAVSKEVQATVACLSRQERHTLCTCLFLTLNWFREVVNAFSGLTDPEMRAKVLGRLQNITEVQTFLGACLEETPGFNPPLANFDTSCPLDSSGASTSSGPPGATVPGKRGKKPKEKKKGGGDNLDASGISTSSTQDTSLDTTQNRSSSQSDAGAEPGDSATVDMVQYRTYFRELDIDVFNILGCGLVSRTVLDSEMQDKETVVLRLQTPELHFLLEDLSHKLDHALPASSSKRRIFLKTRVDKNAGFSHLHRFSPGEIAVKAVKLLPYLCEHLESTSAFFQSLVAQNDGVLDGPGTQTTEYHEMASCLYLLLKSLLSIISWNGFTSSENKQLLTDALTVLTTRIKGKSRTQLSAKLLLKHSFTYLEKFSETVPDLSSAVCLLHLLVALSERAETTERHGSIATMSKGLLRRDWLGRDGLREKGAKHNKLLQSLLRIYLRHTPDVLESTRDLCTVGIPELVDSEAKDKYSATYPTLNRSSFGTYYRIMFEYLVDAMHDLHVGRASSPPRPTPPLPASDQLRRWCTAVRVFHILINLLKNFNARNNLTTALKYARSFVELFLKHGMPLLDKQFPTQRKEVLELLKTLQQSTRALHHICSHSKVAKDMSLTRYVPAMKRNLEQFVYRVKAMLTLNHCQEAFWLGNLKNRDLQGEEILSQQSNETASEGGDSDDDNTELPSDSSGSEDEAESETTVGPEETSDSDDDESYSESF